MPQTLTIDSPEFRSMFPYRSRYFQFGPHKVHYVDEGSGPVLILMHACPMWVFAFRHIIRDFSMNHRVIAIDQIGLGLSDKPHDLDYRLEMHIEMLESFIVQNGLKDITFITHGRGSSIAVGYAVRNPEQVRAFIVMNAMDFSDFALPLRLQLSRINWLEDFLLRRCKLMFWELMFAPKLLRECYELPFRKPEDYNAIKRFVEDIPCGPDSDSAMSMYEIEAGLWLLRDKPTAIFWAKHDWLYGKKCLRHWKKYFPEAELHILKKSGRYLLEDSPEHLNDLIRDFLERNRC